MKKQTSSYRCSLATKQRLAAWWKIFPSFQLAFLILVFGACLLGCSALPNETLDPMPPVVLGFTFASYEIVTGAAKHQTVLTGFLLDNPIAELVVVNIDKNNNRHLHIYAFSGNTWVLRLNTPLRPEVLFVDVVNIEGRDRLITYEQGCLNWFNPESETEHALVTVPSMMPPPHDSIPHVDITHDVNGDARDDLVVPDADGFWVFIQKTNGAFADPVKLGSAVDRDRLYDAEGYRYNPWAQSRIHKIDYNRDGYNDLTFWNNDHFDVHLQNELGLFDPIAIPFTTDVAFDSDDLASLAAPYGVRRRRRDHQPTGSITGRVLHALTDMNGDGIPDLGVFSLKGGSLWHIHSTYEIHFGTSTADGKTLFAPDVSAVLHSDGIPFTMEQHDFNRDGQMDMLFATIKPRIFKAIGMIIDSVLTGYVSLDLEFYCMEGGTYPDQPALIREIKSRTTNETGGRAAFPSVLFADVNGDGRLDLLVGTSQQDLHVFIGIPGPEMFARKPQKVAVTMPTYEEHTWLVNLNNDNKTDVLMHHTSTTEPHRVTLLIAR